MSAVLQSAVFGQVRRLIAVRGADGQSDSDLLQSFCETGDEAAFAALVRRHGSLVFNVCKRVLHHQQDAEDAFQATFLILARNVAAVRNRHALAAWLHRSAYRMALGIRRSADRRRHHEGQATAMTSREPSVDLAWRELQTLLEDEIQRLPEKYRMAFVLCCMEGSSRAEVARLLGIKEGTISSRIDQARKRLQRRLARRGVTLSAVMAAINLAGQTKAFADFGRLFTATARAAVLISAGNGTLCVPSGRALMTRLAVIAQRHAL